MERLDEAFEALQRNMDEYVLRLEYRLAGGDVPSLVMAASTLRTLELLSIQQVLEQHSS